MNKKLHSMVIAAGLVLGASQSFSSTINVTVPDYSPTGTYFGSGPFSSSANSDLEDNETEWQTTPGQEWDLEAFVVSGSKLYVVGGYDFIYGTGGYKPGDLFIKVGGTPTGFAPGTITSGTVDNSVYGYNYAVDLTQNVGASGPAANVYGLNSGSLFDTVRYDDRGANPWRYNSQGSLLNNQTNISVSSPVGDGDASLVALGLGGLVGGSHYIMEVDLGFMGSVAANTVVYFSYTMECGNDSLKGEYSGGFDRVPDETASVLLIGLGLAAMLMVGFKRRQS